MPPLLPRTKFVKVLWVVITAAAALSAGKSGWAQEDETPAQKDQVDADKIQKEADEAIRAWIPRKPPNEAALAQQLREQFQAMMGAAHRLDHIHKVALSDESKENEPDFLRALGVKGNLRAKYRGDFNYYTIRGIKDVIAYKDVAFVVADVKFDPSRLGELRKEEKEAVAKHVDNSPQWTDLGGSSAANHFERDGSGLATYVFLLEHGGWKVHETYFSLEPLSDTDLSGAVKFFEGVIKNLG